MTINSSSYKSEQRKFAKFVGKAANDLGREDFVDSKMAAYLYIEFNRLRNPRSTICRVGGYFSRQLSLFGKTLDNSFVKYNCTRVSIRRSTKYKNFRPTQAQVLSLSEQNQLLNFYPIEFSSTYEFMCFLRDKAMVAVSLTSALRPNTLSRIERFEYRDYEEDDVLGVKSRRYHFLMGYRKTTTSNNEEFGVVPCVCSSFDKPKSQPCDPGCPFDAVSQYSSQVEPVSKLCIFRQVSVTGKIKKQHISAATIRKKICEFVKKVIGKEVNAEKEDKKENKRKNLNVKQWKSHNGVQEENKRKISSYTLRRSAITSAKDIGMPLKEIMNYSTHKSESACKKYLESNPDDRLQVSNSLARARMNRNSAKKANDQLNPSPRPRPDAEADLGAGEAQNIKKKSNANNSSPEKGFTVIAHTVTIGDVNIYEEWNHHNSTRNSNGCQVRKRNPEKENEESGTTKKRKMKKNGGSEVRAGKEEDSIDFESLYKRKKKNN